MAAEVLKLPLEHVNTGTADTDGTPLEFALVGSRGTYTVGKAIIEAAEDARRKILEFGAPVMNLPVDKLDTEDGYIFEIKNPNNRILWRKAMGIRRTIIGVGRFDEDFTLSNFLITFVEVEVDTSTGQDKADEGSQQRRLRPGDFSGLAGRTASRRSRSRRAWIPPSSKAVTWTRPTGGWSTVT